jgi:hypothetical protein
MSKPSTVRIHFPPQFSALLKACKELQKFEINIFHCNSFTFAAEILDYVHIRGMRSGTVEAMGNDVLETVVTTKSPIHGGLLNGR